MRYAVLRRGIREMDVFHSLVYFIQMIDRIHYAMLTTSPTMLTCSQGDVFFSAMKEKQHNDTPHLTVTSFSSQSSLRWMGLWTTLASQALPFTAVSLSFSKKSIPINIDNRTSVSLSSIETTSMYSQSTSEHATVQYLPPCGPSTHE